MGCVNVSSREFRQLAQENNLSSNTLELITHKYWLETGREDLFPSSVYIQAQIGNTQYQEKGKSVRKLWNKKYSVPQVFDTLEESQIALKEARKFFPVSALVQYRNADNKYTLSVKQPVERVNHDKDDFFEGDFPKNVKTMDLGLNEKEVYTIDKVEELFNKFNTDRTSRQLANKVFKVAKDLGLKITFDESLPFGNLGRYTSNNTITYKKSFFERDWMNGLKAPILLHEVLHSLSMYILSEQTKNWERPDALDQFRIDMNSIYQDIQSRPELKGERGIVNLHEFVAELANPVFRQKLQSIDTKKNFWQRILEAFQKWLGITPKSQYYNRAMKALDKALNAFDLDTYLRYNGMRNLLKEGYKAEEWEWRQLSEDELKKAIISSPHTNPELAQLVEAMSKEQLLQELRTIEQEYADYDLIDPESKKEPQIKTGRNVTPQDFTFNDGVTVRSPFKPNNQQIDALNAMSDFINSDETTMTLSGYAGTGKTSLMEMLAQKMRQQYKRIVFSATTNQAAAVLKSRVARSGFEAYTLNKVFGIGVEVDSNKAYDAKKLVNFIKDSDLIFPGDIVAIDEASMINEENYKILNKIAKDNNLKIIYVGDEAQLAPVNEDKISKVFRNGEGKVIRLTQVERTDDNAILKEATNLRDGKPLSGESSFNEKGEGVAYIKPENKTTIADLVKYFVQGLEKNPNYFRILAYTNAAIAKYNDAVRRTLGYTDNTPRVGEPMTGYANWGYDYRTRSYRLINSGAYKVVEVGPSQTVQINIGEGNNSRTVTMQATPITLVDSFGNKDTYNYMDIKGNPENLRNAKLLAQEKSRLFDKARHMPKGDLRASVYSKINKIEEFLFVNDNVMDGNRTLQAKVIDFGYALTIHKSQGSTFTNVLIDDGDVSKASGSMNNAANAVNLGLEADGRDFSNTEIRSTDDVDLGDLSGVETEVATPEAAANIRQQLRYVGVSRATDTVTIISNNVKSEDTPLNHLKQNALPLNLINNDEQISKERKEQLLKDFSRSSEVDQQLPQDSGRRQVSDRGAATGEISGFESSNGLVVASQEGITSFVPHPLLMTNLGIETGERLIQVDQQWKEQELLELDRELGEAPENLKHNIVDRIYEVRYAVARIKLPNYEYLNDLYEDTLVDAEWKIPMLEELDSQIPARMSSEDYKEGEENAILDQMDRILNAATQEELNKPVTGEKKQVEQNLSEFEKLTQQINNLLDSELITASEIRHIAELVVNSISDNITLLQKEEGLAQEQFSTLNTDLDFQNASRKEIVEAVGINRLIHRAKVLFSPEVANYEDIETMMQAALITDNWDAIMTLASDIFAANEGFGIRRDFDKGGFQTTESATIDYDNFNEQQDTETVEEEEGDEQEHWQVESRTLDVLNSMSQMVRLALHECYQIDRDGNKVYSKWGIAERVNPRKTVNSILRWTQGAMSLQDMIDRLSTKQEQNPWLNQLIERLSDQSGKETDFQSQFYGVFSKHFQPYSVVLLEDGKYHSIPVNSHPALSEAMTSITTQFKIGEHPLFTDKGINTKLLGTEHTVSPTSDFNLHKALNELQTIVEGLKHGGELTADIAKQANADLTGVSKILGYPVSEEMIDNILNNTSLERMTNALVFIVKSLDNALQEQRRDVGKTDAKQYNPFAYGAENNIGASLRNFLTPITEQLEDTAINAFYDSGKMYQSYVTPSFMTKLMNKFRLEGQAFEDFIMSEYGNSEWFKTPGGDINSGWRNEWLRLLARDENARKVFDHKVELNFNKHNYMRNMSDAEYTLSLITEYFAETAQKGQSMVPAWFRIPMQSNKPSSEFIKFLSYRGAEYKNQIVDGLYKMFLQELSRIQTTRMRNHDKGDSEFIKNFDSNGRKFSFLPFLNSYLENTETAKKDRILLRNVDNTVSEDNNHLAQLLQKKVEGLEKLSADEEAALLTLVQKAIYNHMEGRAQQILNNWENSGILEAAKSIKGIGEEDAIRSNIENFLWNDNFAAKNILQLTITDIAFYKDAEDLQKRLAQLHAPGIRGNVNATDYDGNKVSDGTYRTIILQDWDNFRSNIIANIAEVFDRKITRAPENQKAQLKALKESLVGENGKYRKINVADAQGYSSPASYRKKAFIFGRWSHKAEDIYQKLLKGDYNYSDLETAFQPLKPFVYSHLQKNMGVANAPIQTMNVPFQAKNAEYLLIMADAIISGEEAQNGRLSRPNLLRAVYRVMEESERLNPTKGIDTVQFESAIKSGLQGRLNIHQFAEMPGGEEAAYIFMMNQIFKEATDAEGQRIYKDYNTDTFVHEAAYEDYCMQQEVPAHFRNHAQAHGSQIRMIIPSDLDLYKNPNGDKAAEDNQVYYEWTEPDGTHKKMKANEFKKEYENTIAANIAQSIEELRQELHIDSEDKKERNIALSKILQREILASPRYGVDLIQACSIDKETGEFRIPKGDPIQSKRIEQLINSIIKNKVNKQKIAGGPIVQVSNFGTSKQLHIRFKSKQGGLLMTEEEYKENPQKKEISQTDKFNAKYRKGAVSGTMTYKEYVKENQAGIAYFEVFVPIWSQEIFEKFSNNDGTINMEALEATDPELLKMVSYRIPTEDKYSCAPMKAVGFMPREAGDAIMLPYELTEIDDSDFDVDKRYVMLKNYADEKSGKIFHKRPRHEVEQELFEKLSKSYQRAHEGKTADKFIKEQIKMFMDNPEKMRHTDALMESLYKEYQKIAYYTKAPVSGKNYRDNKIIDMTLAVLTNEMTADKILNPGGFDNFKKSGYMIAAYKNSNMSWQQLQNLSIDELKELSSVGKDLTWADTQIHFYHQNAAGSNLIGVFAVNKVAHATLEGNDIYIAVDEICGDDAFTIADMTFGGKMAVDPMLDKNGNLIGKTIGSGVSASADTAKEPTLDLMNINMTTAGVFNTMLRLGMPMEDAALVLSQDVVGKVLEEFNRKNLTNYEPLSHIIGARLSELQEKHNIDDASNINTEPLTKEELIEGLADAEHEVVDYKVLLAFQKLRSLAEAVRKLTFATRFNSISSAVGPLIIDNLILEHKIEQFQDSNLEDGTHFYTAEDVTVDIDDVFFDHPILKQFATTVDIAKKMFYDMPAGSVGFRNLLNSLPEGLIDKFYSDKKLLDQLSNFYQSYLLVASGFLNESQLKNYIDGFPKWFMKQELKEKYPDNALIQAIKMGVSKRTNRAYLNVNITGADAQVKEELGNAWIDLHKADPELSTRLAIYNIFRAGVGFSPKTFMSLVPTYVKERLERELPNGGKATYVDTYRIFPTVNPSVVIDQFIRNNWDNNKLVPKKGGEGTKYQVDLKRGTLIVRDKNDMNDLDGVTYMKTRHNGQTYLWKLIGADKYAMNYIQVKPLGSNGEYLEMSLTDIQRPLSETVQTIEDMTNTEIKEQSPQETDALEGAPDSVVNSQITKNLVWFADGIMKQRESINKPVSRSETESMLERMKNSPDMFGDYFVNVFRQLGINLTKEDAVKEFKKLC